MQGVDADIAAHPVEHWTHGLSRVAQAAGCLGRYFDDDAELERAKAVLDKYPGFRERLFPKFVEDNGLPPNRKPTRAEIDWVLSAVAQQVPARTARGGYRGSAVAASPRRSPRAARAAGFAEAQNRVLEKKQ